MNTVKTNTRYLIIGGTTKAATTSLFNYLSEHPEIAGTSIKETRFFIDDDYPVQPQISSWKDGIEKFQEFFPQESERIRLDATPDYLYSLGTADRINRHLIGAQVIFILRNPITRLISWYKYAKQRNNIPQSMNLEGYIEAQLENQYFQVAKKERIENPGSTPFEYFMSALEQGLYSSYVEKYIDSLGRDRVKIYFYEELCENPQAILEDICEFISISPQFYRDYTFKVYNPSLKVRNTTLNSVYDQIRRSIRKRTHNLPVHKNLRQLKNWVEPIYLRLNTQSSENIEVSQDIKLKLKDYYREDIIKLENIIKHRSPWGDITNV